MDAEKSKANQNHRINAFAFCLCNVAFYTIIGLWHFDVFHSANDCGKFNHYPYTFKKNKQQVTFGLTHFCCCN